MKQTIGIGAVVDDGSGDYLRLGGQKINNNFNEIYSELGDGNVPYPAGAWKTHKDAELSPGFGQSFTLDTTDNAIKVTLPRGTAADFGKVIKLRDVWGTWRNNNVNLMPTTPDTIKGGSVSRSLVRDFQDVELVYSSPGNWEYLDNKLINRISPSDISTVSKKEIVATEGQIDFMDIFGEAPYNIYQLEVYRRGNLMYYGSELSDTSDYGSPGTGNEVIALDGKNIRLRVPCKAGDVMTFITYLDDIAVYRTSYVSRTIKVFNTTDTEETVPGQTWVGDLSTKKVWKLEDFGLNPIDGTLNPFATEVLINGRSLTMAGQGDLPTFACETTDGASIDADTENSCIAAGGQWVDSGIDFSVVEDPDTTRLSCIKIHESLENEDLLTVRWYNNEIGTTMEWEEIKNLADQVYLNNEYRFTRKNKIRYNSYNNPTPRDVEVDLNQETNIKFTDVVSLLESIYPVGSMYFNAHNKANPAEYMGFGTWISYGRGQTVVGWIDGTDANFSYYNDSQGQLVAPGGSGGKVSHTILPNEIPTLTSTDEVLIKDPNGDVLIGQCQLDPDDEGPGYKHYREDTLQSNVNAGAASIPLLQPYMTVSTWLRVA